MDNFLKMDIFFVVSTAAVVVATVLLTVVIVRVLRILKKLEELTTMVNEEGEQIRQDIDAVRESVREGGMRLGHVLGFLPSLGKPKRRTKAKTKS